MHMRKLTSRNVQDDKKILRGVRTRRGKNNEKPAERYNLYGLGLTGWNNFGGELAPQADTGVGTETIRVGLPPHRNPPVLREDAALQYASRIELLKGGCHLHPGTRQTQGLRCVLARKNSNTRASLSEMSCAAAPCS